MTFQACLYVPSGLAYCCPMCIAMDHVIHALTTANDAIVGEAVSLSFIPFHHYNSTGIKLTMTARDYFWSIPIIQDAIASHLDKNDFWNCVQSCSDLHHCFLPFLWRTVTPTRARNIPLFHASTAHSRGRRFVHSLRFTLWHLDAVLCNLNTFGPFPHLVHLKFEVDEEAVGFKFLDFASAHLATLESLEIKNVEHSQEFMVAFWQFMRNVNKMGQPGRLRHLALELDEGFVMRYMAKLMLKCTTFEKLLFRCGPFERGSHDSLQDLTVSSLPESRVKELTFLSSLHETRAEGIEDLLVLLLKHCPRLEKLELPNWIKIEDSFGQLALVLENQCLKLTDLMLDSEKVETEALLKILKTCPRLKRLQLQIRKDPNAVVYAVLHRHGETLEELDFSLGSPILVDAYFAVTRSCPNLRVFRVGVKWRKISEELLERMRNVWEVRSSGICTKLRTLMLEFAKAGFGRKPWLDGEVLKGMVQDIGRCSDLRELELVWGDQDVKYRSAFLGCLKQGDFSGLKELRGLVVVSSYGSGGFTEDDVGEMVLQWPLLQSVSRRRGEEDKVIVSEARAKLEGADKAE